MVPVLDVVHFREVSPYSAAIYNNDKYANYGNYGVIYLCSYICHIRRTLMLNDLHLQYIIITAYLLYAYFIWYGILYNCTYMLFLNSITCTRQTFCISNSSKCISVSSVCNSAFFQKLRVRAFLGSHLTFLYPKQERGKQELHVRAKCRAINLLV